MITEAIIKKIAPTANKAFLKPMVEAMGVVLPEYGINTSLRVAHFLAQAAHESDGFKTMQEYASGAAYEGRKDLGNVKKGDGKRYKGRGIFQLTGRANYRRIGEKLTLPLEAEPQLAADPRNAVLIACQYWQDHGLNKLADADKLVTITRKINGGLNGLENRRQYLSRAKAALGSSPVAFVDTKAPEQPKPETEAGGPFMGPSEAVSDTDPLITPQSGDFLIKALQTELKAKHYYDGSIDGVWTEESLTDDAVALLQKRNGMEMGVDAIRLSEVRAANAYIVATRVDATVETLKERGDPATTFFGRIKAGVKWFLSLFGIGGVAAATAPNPEEGTGHVIDKASDTLSLLERGQALLASVPAAIADTFFFVLHWLWAPVIVCLLAAWLWSRHAEKQRLAAFKTGAA